jgi:hypothetical protein
MRDRIEFIVYLAGVILLGLCYAPLKTFLGGEFWFFLAVVAYLLVLRGIGRFLRNKLSSQANS